MLLQNKLIDLMPNNVKEQLLTEIRTAKYFSVIGFFCYWIVLQTLGIKNKCLLSQRIVAITLMMCVSKKLRHCLIVKFQTCSHIL